jgi:signal transduction histidine kinase
MDGEHVFNSINSIIEESLLIIRNEYKYTIDVHTQLDNDDEIYCNKGQIEQVLINMLMNAIHAIKSMQRVEKGNINISTMRVDERFQIVISDDGPGVPEELLNRIFDPFFTTKDIGKGTGLGLSISYDIVVNKHNGRISVSNQTPSGAVFEIELPVRHNNDQPLGDEI